MKLVVSFLLAALLATPLFAADSKPSATGPVIVIPVRSMITEAQFAFLRRGLKEAERRNASAVVLDLDTYGGEVTAAVDEMQALLRMKMPTYTYVNSKAISAGALITLATQKVYMTPTAVIGAAAPVMETGEDLPKTMSDKAISMMSAIGRGAAEKCGHNPDLADAFVRKEAELKIGDVVLNKSDTLLTLDATEAAKKYNGKPLLAEGIADSLEDMLKMAGLTGHVERVEPTGFERLAVFLTAFSALLLLGGIVGAYIEIKTPGFGVPGVTSIICFTLFFAAQYGAGLAGWEVAVLFLAGVLLVLSEVFLHPGTVLPGLAGVVLMVLALIWAMIDRYPGDPWWPSDSMIIRPMLNLLGAFIGAAIVIYFLGKYLPRSRFFRWIILSETTPHGAGQMLHAPPALIDMGAAGTAHTTLRPSGKGEFAGRLLDVVTQGDFIEAGRGIRVVAVEGTRVVVAPA